MGEHQRIVGESVVSVVRAHFPVVSRGSWEPERHYPSFSLTLMLPFLILEQAARLKKLQEQDKQQKVEFRKRVRATGELKGSFWKDLQ